MNKLQSFFVLKIDSSRLKNSSYTLDISFDDALANSEVVRLGDNQVLRTLRKIKGVGFSGEFLSILTEKKKTAVAARFSTLEIDDEVNRLLFVPEVINVVFSNKSHYRHVIDNGFIVNGKKYIRLLGGAGMLRKNTVMFCDVGIATKMRSILDAHRDVSKEIVPAKFNAYYGLYSTAGLVVTFPRVCVVDDAEETTSLCNKDVPVSLFDGMGIVSPRLARVWGQEMGLDYLPSWFIFRAPFFKGLLATFDFHAFAQEIAQSNSIADVWGNVHRVEDIDVIATASQFKLWKSYPSFHKYREACFFLDLEFLISRPAPKQDKDFFLTNYQFLQPLSFSDKQIEDVCKPTVDFFSRLAANEDSSLLLYLLGDGVEKAAGIMLNDSKMEAVALDARMSNDPGIFLSIDAALSKKKKESKLGKLIFPGNFQAMISDPFAFCEHAFGLSGVDGLLLGGRCYSEYWFSRGVKKIAACRAPMILDSEINVLDVCAGSLYWYQYISTGIVYSIHDDTMLRQGGSD
jgi:hypothetical protein